MQPQSTTKVCACCKQSLPITEFWKAKGRRDGLQPYCRTCQTAKTDKWRIEHPDQHKAFRQEWDRREATKSKQRERRMTNRERDAATKRKYYQNNREHILARTQEYRRDRPEVGARAVKAYRARNPNIRREIIRRYEARKQGATIGAVSYEEIRKRDKGICHICHNPVPSSRIHFDHVIPLSRGGSHSQDNIKVSHARCNLKKGSKTLA